MTGGRRVHLHVGTMKSGTTFLQGLCRVNERALRDNGLLWPGARLNFAAMEELLETRPKDPPPPGSWEELRRGIADFDGEAVISNELLLQHEPQQLARLVSGLAPAESHVVITARDLARVVPSQWQTMVRSRSTATWSDFVGAVCTGRPRNLAKAFWARHDLPKAIDRLSKVVPKERITLVTVPPPGSDPTLLGHRFLSSLGVTLDPMELPRYRKESLGAHSAELVRRLNLETSKWSARDHRRVMRRVVSKQVLERRGDKEPRIGLRTEQVQTVSAVSAEMVQTLRASGVRVVGDLADLVPDPDRDYGGADPGATTPEELAAAATFGLVGLARFIADGGTARDPDAARRHPPS